MPPIEVEVIDQIRTMLADEFPRISEAEVRRELLRGSRHLDGQVPSGALAEMLYILVRYRLHRRNGEQSDYLGRAAS